MVRKTNYTAKNSKEYVEKICSYKLNNEECLVSLDVVSLFIKVRINLALQVAKQRLCNDSTLNDRTELSVNDIILAIKLCLEATNLTLRTFLSSNLRHCYGISGLSDCCKHGKGNN